MSKEEEYIEFYQDLCDKYATLVKELIKELKKEKDNFTGYKLFKDGKEVASIDLSKDGGVKPKKLKK